MKERMTAHFSGTVQGVGFRYTTVNIARRFPDLGGYVKNLSDGRVELVAEGEGQSLNALLDGIKAAYVQNMNNRQWGKLFRI